MELVDTHCHPHFADFAADPERVVTDAAAAGVTRLIVVGTTLEDSQSAVDFAARHKSAWAAAGVHPHAAKEFAEIDDAALELRSLLAKPKIVAVGEIGLDFYRSYSGHKDQEDALRSQIEEGLSTGLPFIFHIRDAWDSFWPILDSYKDLRGVVHSFSAYQQQLDQALQRGLYVGLNGIMTFSKDQKQLEAAKKMPLDRLLLETDAPFLAPKPYRGQRCEPKHTRTVAEFLANLRGESLEELAVATTKNAIDLFNLDGND
jgi:TatD DNase family protein